MTFTSLDAALSSASRAELESALRRCAAQLGEEAVLGFIGRSPAVDAAAADAEPGAMVVAAKMSAKGPAFTKKKKGDPREFVMESYRQRHVAVRIMYDGRPFAGFAAQTMDGGPPKAKRGGDKAGREEVAERRLETVEAALKAALLKTRLFGHPGTAPHLAAAADGAGERASGDGAWGEEGKEEGGVDAEGFLKLAGGNGYSRCGRTDRGVSALGQVIALPLRSAFSKSLPEAALPVHPCDALTVEAKPNVHGGSAKKAKSGGDGAAAVATKEVRELDYCSALNACLPDSIRALAWAPVSRKFSARFSAQSRTYRYFFPRRDLNLQAMADASALLEGDHDFRHLCKIDAANVSNFRRKINRFRVRRQSDLATVPPSSSSASSVSSAWSSGGVNVSSDSFHAPAASSDVGREMWFFEVEGQAFLWHQVRCMVAVLFLVGSGLESKDVVSHLLAVDAGGAMNGRGTPQYTMAADPPLVLHGCGFSHLIFEHSPEALWKLTATLEARWADAAVAAAQAKNALDEVLAFEVRAKDVQALQLFHGSKEHSRDRAKGSGGHPPLAKRMKLGTDEGEGGNDGCSTKLMRWSDALASLGGVAMAPGERKSHVPLLLRCTSKSLEQKVESLHGKQKARKERHDGMRSDQDGGQSDAAFFATQRSEGSMGHTGGAGQHE